MWPSTAAASPSTGFKAITDLNQSGEFDYELPGLKVNLSERKVMTEKVAHTVRFEPVGIEIEVDEDETVLEAAFRQGVSLMHGCKEGQCASCKSVLCNGDVELLKYSTFALSDTEREQDRILLCRTIAYSDLVVELLNFDEGLLARSIPVRTFDARITSIESLTHDIRRLEILTDQPLRFWAGQYVDITVPESGVTRSFSMANPPSQPNTLEFIIKIYPQGAFSSLLKEKLRHGDPIEIKGPYGSCLRHENRPGSMILVGGGSGMAPLLSILTDLVESGEQRPVRFFYGARTKHDLFMLDRIEELGLRLRDFSFIPALSGPGIEADWVGETGFIHEVLGRHLQGEFLDGEADAYSCGPPPMIDAVLPVLQMSGLEPENIHFDKFTAAVR
jgi:propane monooxygenase reductase subunit